MLPHVCFFSPHERDCEGEKNEGISLQRMVLLLGISTSTSKIPNTKIAWEKVEIRNIHKKIKILTVVTLTSQPMTELVFWTGTLITFLDRQTIL